MKRVIRTASGSMSLGQYCDTWRKVKAAPAGTEFRSSLRCSFGGASREKILGEFREGIHHRINKHMPSWCAGRKWNDAYQVGLARDARRLREIAERVRVYQFETAEIVARYGHKLARHDD